MSGEPSGEPSAQKRPSERATRPRTVQLADTFMVRAAAFPLNQLLTLGTEPLHTLRGAVTVRDRTLAYDEIVERERIALHAETCRSDTFLKALTLSNPQLAARARTLSCKRVRNKRVRHLETTLFRYLSRATTRTTPGDLWAGVTVGVRSTRTAVTECPAVIQCEPDLRPLVALFNGVVTADRARVRWRLNPTVQVQGDELRFVTPDARALGLAFEGAGVVVERLRLRESAGLFEYEDDLRNLWPDLDAEALLAVLIERGLLVTAQRFPYRFASVWEALRQAQADLPRSARDVWQCCTNELRTLCLALETGYGSWSADEVAALQEQAATCVAGAGRALGVHVEVPRAPLRANLRAGLRVQLGPELWAQLRIACDDFSIYQRQLALGPALATWTSESLASRFQGDQSLVPLPLSAPFQTEGESLPLASTWEDVACSVRAGLPLQQRLTRMSKLLAQGGDSVVFLPTDEPGLPVGTGSWAMLCGLRIGRKHSVHGLNALVPHPHSLHGRVAELLSPVPGAAELHQWLRGQLDTCLESEACEAVEVVGPFDHTANVLSRPASGLPVIDPWRPDASDILLSDLVMRAGKLFHHPTGKQIRAHWLSAANPADAVSELLTSTIGYLPRLLRFETASLPLRVETQQLCTPEVRLSHGARIRPRRSVVAGADLKALLAMRDKAERFVRWLALAEARDWPRLVRVRFAGRSPIVIPTHSPLAVESLCEGQRWSEGARLIVEDFDGDVGITLPDGRHYVAELAVFGTMDDPTTRNCPSVRRLGLGATGVAR